MTRVLLVEDDVEIGEPLVRLLTQSCYTVDWARDIRSARAFASVARFELALLDRRLPDGDGAGLLESLRRFKPPPRVILLTALDAKQDRVGGLDLGADDYVVKPFEPEELLARMRALLRRDGRGDAEPLRFGALLFDTRQRQFYVQQEPLALRRRELSVLEKLMARPGAVVMREALEAATFSVEDDVSHNTLETHVSRLRKRLREAGAGVAISAIRGVGYFLELESR
jgi:two-component system OmpR family response regulator